jgi:hypothetical protein
MIFFSSLNKQKFKAGWFDSVWKAHDD